MEIIGKLKLESPVSGPALAKWALLGVGAGGRGVGGVARGGAAWRCWRGCGLRSLPRSALHPRGRQTRSPSNGRSSWLQSPQPPGAAYGPTSGGVGLRGLDGLDGLATAPACRWQWHGGHGSAATLPIRERPAGPTASDTATWGCWGCFDYGKGEGGAPGWG